MSGCRKSDFNDLASCLRHVQDCEFLPHAQYWCPHCRRDESYIAEGMHRSTPSKEYRPADESKLRDRVVCFLEKQFGLGRKRDPLASYKLPLEFQALERTSSEEGGAEAYYTQMEGMDAFPSSSQESKSFPLEICTMDRGSYVPFPGELPGQYSQFEHFEDSTQMLFSQTEDIDGLPLYSQEPEELVPEICTMNRGSYVPLQHELPDVYEPLWTRVELSSPEPFLQQEPMVNLVELSSTRFSTSSDPAIQHRKVRQISISPSIPQQWEDGLQVSPHSALVSPELLPYNFQSNSFYSRRSSEERAPERTPERTMEEATDFEPETHDAELACQGSAQLPNQISSSESVRHSVRPKDLTDTSYDTGMPVGSHEEGQFTDSFIVDIPKSDDPLGSTPDRAISGISGNRLISQPSVLTSSTWDRESSDGRTSSKSHHGPVDLRLQIPLSFTEHHGIGHSKQRLIGELGSVVKVLAALWTEELGKIPAFSSMIPRLYNSSPIQVGLKALRRFLLSSNIPTTITETFHFAHIAFACAYLTHTQDGWYPWEVFYQGIERLGQGITDPQDRALYPKLAEFLWSTPRTALHPNDVHWSDEFDNRMPISNSANRTSTRAPQSQAIIAESDNNPSDKACGDLVFIRQMRNGNVMSRCTRYLDGQAPHLLFRSS